MERIKNIIESKKIFPHTHAPIRQKPQYIVNCLRFFVFGAACFAVFVCMPKISRAFSMLKISPV